ncbi:MAG: Ig-like domain-containing domain [Mangrovibacterium sp.]
MKKFIYILMAACFGYMIFQTSCANIGMPTGGDKDSIPPVVLRIDPSPNQTNFDKQVVTMTFDEFVVSSDVPTKMLVSPPIKKKADVKMRAKTITIDFKEQLQENMTYAIDFRNSIKDNNEGNPMEDFRVAFSTGNELDSLMVGGYVRMAQTMEPMEDVLISLYAIDSLHYFRDSIPNYVGMSNEEGFFMISNIKEGKYRLYAVQDLDNSLTYNSTEELIGFIDTLIAPTVMDDAHHDKHELFDESIKALLPDSIDIDSLLAGIADSVQEAALFETLPDTVAKLITQREIEHQHEHKHHLMQPYFLMLYAEEEFDQYLNTEERKRKNLCSFYFEDSLSDSFRIELVKPKIDSVKDWSLVEYSLNRDSLFVWITDTALANMDTLGFALTYTMLDDSLRIPYMQTDTINLTYTDPDANKKKKKVKAKDEEEEVEEVPHFSFNSNAGKDFDIFKKLTVVSAEPVKALDYSMIHLCKVENDTIETPLDFEFTADSLNLCRYYVNYPWKFEEKYNFYIDSAAAVSISEMPSNALKQQLSIRAEDYYAKIVLDVSNVTSPTLFQIIKSGDKKESPISSKTVTADGEIEFPLLSPDKFIIKAVFDSNENGKWDCGDIDTGLQPERVVYHPKILKLRSNFEVKETWALPTDINKEKELIDEDELEKDKFKGQNGKR